MNIFNTMLILLTFSTELAFSRGGTIVGNGGDTVRCRNSASNNFKGLYTLDYALTYQKRFEAWEAKNQLSAENHLKRVASKLRSHYPDLAYLFDDYLRYLGNLKDESKFRIWRKAPFGMNDIKDEQIKRKLPKNCYKLADAGKISIIQTVIRYHRDNQIVYKFVPQTIKELKEQRPLQYSFLMVHEWLWDLSMDPTVNREVNRYIHSQSFDDASADEMRAKFKRMGIDLRKTAQRTVDTCKRTPKFRHAIEDNLNKACKDIEMGTLRSFSGTFTAKNAGINIIRLGDLWGLHRGTTKLILAGNEINYWLEDSLTGFHQLNWLDLSSNKLNFVSSRMLADQKNLRVLNLAGNRLSAVPRNLLIRNQKMRVIDFSNNQISTIDPSLFKVFNANARRCRNAASTNPCTINLSGNRLTKVPDNIVAMIHPEASATINLENNRLSKLLLKGCWQRQKGNIHLRLKGNSFSDRDARLIKYQVTGSKCSVSF